MKGFRKTDGLAGLIVLFSVTAIYAMGHDHMMGHDSAWCAENIRSFGFISPGISWVDLGKINSDLTALGFSSFRQYTGTVSLGGQQEMGRMIMESTINGLFWKDHLDSTIRTSVWMGNIVCNTGFNVFPAAMPVAVYPLLGIGAGLNTLRVRSNEKSVTEILASTEPASLIWQASFLLHAGAGLDLKMPNRQNTKGLVLGLRAGYVFDPFRKTKWYSDGTMVDQLSSMYQKGAYVRLVFGGWDKSRQH